MILKTSIVLTLALITSVVQAHDSPEHTIDEINRHKHLTPEQLHQRAIAQRATSHNDLAIADLQAAIRQKSNQIGYHLDLARTHLADQNSTKTLQSANQALKLATTSAQRATIHILRAEAYQLDKKTKQSLAATQLAFLEIPRGEIEWYLLRAECQRTLHLDQERITNLETGLKHYPSAVLQFHWIDALIDATHFSKALKEIDQELVDRRWKSSYLIKRARALTGLKREDEAKADLRAAITEITPRINPARPDPILLADQGIAYALLGQPDKARANLKELKIHHTPAWITDRLQEEIQPK